MGKSTKIKSSHIRFGKRTFFFDVNEFDRDKRYLKITESQFMGEGKDRIYNSFLLYPESVEAFQKTLTEAAGLLS